MHTAENKGIRNEQNNEKITEEYYKAGETNLFLYVIF